MTEKHQAGIYQIINKINGKIYVGSTTSIDGRWRRHKYELNEQRHINKHLQAAWNKYGPHSFEYSVIELISDVDCLLEREQHWLDHYKAYDRKVGYNILHVAGSPIGSKRTLAARRKMSKSQRERVKSPEERERRRVSALGRKHSPETKEKIRQANLRRSPELLKELAKKRREAFLRKKNDGKLPRSPHSEETKQKNI